MSMSDPIADMLTRIRNASNAKFEHVDIPGSKLKTELAKILKDEGFIKDYKFTEDGKQGVLRVLLKYANNNGTIYGISRVSKPSRRVYVKSRDIKPVLNGMGVAIISTPKGLLTDKAARHENVGGEVICTVW